jgi:putative ABC transport system permease protein
MQKSADINGGTGIVVIGLACLIIGETLINGRKNMGRNILACLIGNIVYRLIYAIILRTSIIPIECLKLVTAIIVALAIAAPTIKENMQYALKARREGKN